MARGLFSITNLKKDMEADKNIASLFLKKIEESIITLESDYTPSIWYKPSSLICKRQMYFTRKGIKPEEEKKDPCMIGILESGTDRHERIQKVLTSMKELGMDFEYIDVETYVKENNLIDIEIISKQGMETKCFNKRYKMSFLTDGIIKHIPTNNYYIFEYKTEVSQKFSKREKEELSHQSQATAYSISFGINDTLFVYEDRNFCAKKCFHYHVTEQDKREKVIDKIMEVENCLEKEIIPPKVRNIDIDKDWNMGQDRISGPSAKVCMYCKFKKECNKYV